MTNEEKDVRRLNRALQRYVQRIDIRARLKRVGPHVAESEMESGKIKMLIDPDTAPRLQSYIHEILHWYYKKQTEGVPYTIHERWIQATEMQLWEFISQDKRRVKWWRKVCRR